MPSALQVAPFGPFTRGVSDDANPSVPTTGALRVARNACFTGAFRLGVRPGTTVALTLLDDAATPAPVSAVCALAAFGDGALAVGWSAATQAAYLYRLAAGMDGWVDAAGVPQATRAPRPVAVLWTGMASAPGITVAEGLGVAYLAHTEAADAGALRWPTRTWDGTALGTLTADLDGTGGAEPLYFRGVIGFQQHLWGWGFGAGTTVGTGFRPELARFSAPNFGAGAAQPFAASDSLTLGDNVRSARERIVGAGVVGDALYLGGPTLLTRVTGFGRDSWYRQPVERSYGFAGPRCGVTAGDALYYWSPRGPARITAGGGCEPLWDAVSAFVAGLPAQASAGPVAAFDADRDLVTWTLDAGDGGRTWVGYDVRRQVFVGPSVWGTAVACAAAVAPVPRTLVAGPPPPPTDLRTYVVTASTADVQLTPAAADAEHVLEWRVGTTGPWTVGCVLPPAPAGVPTGGTLGGLTPATPYQWRATARRGGLAAPPTEPTPGTTFTTQPTSAPPAAPDAPTLEQVDAAIHRATLRVTFAPREPDAPTEVWLAGPSDVEPAPGAYTLRRTAPAGSLSAEVVVAAAGTYWARVRTARPGAAPGVFSASGAGVAAPAGKSDGGLV